MNLSEKQTEIVNTQEKNVVVLSCAASGKTSVLVERIKYLINIGSDPSKIVALTFTNAAAEEMRRRTNAPSTLFIGTIHSYANYLLLSSGIDTEKAISNEDFDKLFNMISHNPYCLKQVDYLLLDEAQDSNELQFKFILEMVKPNSFFLCGDIRQSIYGFNNSRPDILVSIMKRKDTKVYDMNENYRNGFLILNFARRMISKLGNEYYDTSIAKCPQSGKVIEIQYNEALIKKYILAYGKFGDWFVLTRTNKQLETIKNYLEKNDIPCDTFKKADVSYDELNKKMNENTVKVLTIHSAKGLEANNVIVIGAEYWKDEERRVNYVAATRAKNLLIWVNKMNKKKTISNWE